MADEKKGMAAKLSLPPDIEATVTETPVKSSSNTISSQSQHHHYPHLPRRARHFLRPDGRKVHIAFSPDEAVRLRRRLSAIEKDEFDMVIHGSDQHVRTTPLRPVYSAAPSSLPWPQPSLYSRESVNCFQLHRSRLT